MGADPRRQTKTWAKQGQAGPEANNVTHPTTPVEAVDEGRIDRYDPKAIEAHWQQRWEKDELYRAAG